MATQQKMMEGRYKPLPLRILKQLLKITPPITTTTTTTTTTTNITITTTTIFAYGTVRRSPRLNISHR